MDSNSKRQPLPAAKDQEWQDAPVFINEPAAQVLAAMGVGTMRKGSGLLFPGVTPAADLVLQRS
jgi:hypothetical protein